MRTFLTFIGRLVQSGAILLTLILPPNNATASEDYPAKPITLIIPFSAGGSHDLNARVFTSVISSYLDQPMVVKLMPGGAGQRGVAETVRAKPDGYTLLFGHNFLDQLQPIVNDLSYDPLTDLVTVWKLNDTVPVIYVRSDSRFQAMPEIVEFARQKPGELVYPHSGKWGFSFTVGTTLFTSVGMEVRYVPYKGGGPVKAAILSGDGDFASAPYSSLRELHEAGKIRILAVAAAERLDALPDVTSFAELGYPHRGLAMERIVMAPADTPIDRLQILQSAFASLYDDKSFLRLMQQLRENLNFSNGSDYEAVRREQHNEYQALIRQLQQ